VSGTLLPLGGVVLRIDRQRFFLPAHVVVKLAPLSPITTMAGMPPGLLGLTLHDGAILPLMEIGPARLSMIVCLYRGEAVALVGGEDLETGVFEAAADGGVVTQDGERAIPLDFEAICARVHAARWGAAWRG
jgi:CheW-like domain